MQFVRISASHFKSFETLEVTLGDHGFVKINGVNATDNFSKSVGSGKSTIADAISYALTGETVKGNSSMDDVKNMYTTGICRVQVDFIFNEIEYSIVRGEKDLLLIEGGNDISKHLRRETQQLISEKFPMFTPTFLGATVIIGQNMPNSFTNNKPSARKQILEELTNSSFMIEEVKAMLTERKTEWTSELSNLNTKKVVLESQVNSNNIAIARAKDGISGLRSSESISDEIVLNDGKIAEIELEINGINKEVENVNDTIMAHGETHTKLEEAYSAAVGESSKLSTKLDEARVAHSDATMKAMEGMLAEKQGIETEMVSVRGEISAKESEKGKLNRQIQTLKNAPTHCPTCKQPLPDAHKIDTTAQESEVEALAVAVSSLYTRSAQLGESLKPLLDKISKFKVENQTNSDIERLKSEISEANIAVANAREEVSKSRRLLSGHQETLNTLKSKISKLQSNISSIKDVISRLKIELGEVDVMRSRFEQDILRAETEIKNAELSKLSIDKEVEAKQARLSTLNQVISFASRDFRTILLTNIIQRLDAYAKHYCKKMLDTTAIEFKDDGNNISISFRGRDFGVLSGGESQIVKMCITLALKKTLEDLVGFTTNLMFFDEILDNADQSTAQQIVELVSGLELSSTFFISHHEDVYIPIDRTWTVTKTNNISQLRFE